MLRDRFLRPITVGCVIAYPGRADSRCWITTGNVTEIVETQPVNWPEGRTWRPKIKVDGGSRGSGEKQLGRRTVYHSRDVIVVFQATDV